MSIFSEEDSLSGKPLYYQGKFMSGHSMRSDDDITQRSLRPGTYGTLTAADVGSFQLPGGGSNDYPRPGVFNLPRYYPKYKSFAGGGGESIKSRGSWPRQSVSSYKEKGDAGIDRDEPVYAKPNKLKNMGAQQQPAVITLDDGQTTRSQCNETFTVVDGFDEESLTDKKRRQRKTRTIAICVVSVVIFSILAGVAIFLGVYLSSKYAKTESSISSSTTLGTSSTTENGFVVTTTTSGVSYSRVAMTTVESSPSSRVNDIHGNTVKNTVLLDNSQRTSAINESTSTSVPPDINYNHTQFPSTLPSSSTRSNHSISTSSFTTGSLVAIFGSTSDEKINNSTSSLVSVFESSTQPLTSESFTSEESTSTTVEESSTDANSLVASFSSTTESDDNLSPSTVSAKNTSEETISSSLFTSLSLQSSAYLQLNHTNNAPGLITSSV